MIKRILRNMDWWLLGAVIILMGCGLVLIDSATHSFAMSTGRAWHVERQSMFMVVGLIALVFSLFFDYHDLEAYANKIYIFNIVLLVAVMAFGHTQLGAQRWIQIGPISFQPSEFSKIFLIISLAAFMHKRFEWLDTFTAYLAVFAYIFLPFILVMKQPDLGTSLTFIAILLGMIFVRGFKYSWFIKLGGLFVLMLPGLWHILKDYQKNRIRVFLDPELDPFGSGYHVIQSKIAIGSGGLWGKGWLAGSQSQLNFLPENHTDFIFAVVGEEFGFIGTFFIILVYMVIIWRSLLIAMEASEANDYFGTLVASGAAAMLMFHILVNIGMTAGVMPVTGVPLPFLSYGVSSLTTNLMLVALLLNIRTHNYKLQF